MSECSIKRQSVLTESGIDIVQIIIAVLIARIVVIWMDVVARYARSLTYRHQLNDEYRLFHSRWRSSIISTGIITGVIIIIYSWYIRTIVQDRYLPKTDRQWWRYLISIASTQVSVRSIWTVLRIVYYPRYQWCKIGSSIVLDWASNWT